jgi:gephyrin
MRAGILTVSDSRSSGEAEDRSGPQLRRLLCHSLNVPDDDVETACVPDDVHKIQEVLRRWSDGLGLSLILTTGGTGFASRDVTPEATRGVLTKEAPGLTIAMITGSLAITPLAMLSRPVCGIRNSTLIINLPGSTKGSKECFELVLPALPHALELLSGSPQVTVTHSQMQTAPSNRHTSHVCPHGHHQHSNSHQHQESTAQGKRTKEDFFTGVASRPRHSPYPLVPVEQALQTVLQHTPQLPHTHLDSLSEALGAVIAEDVYAQEPHPPFPASVKDGYAVIAADGPGERTVLAPVTAGEKPTVEVVPGCVCRITTGAPLPPGADAVVQVEDTELLEKSEDGIEEKRVRILSTVKLGHDVRPVGFDIGKGKRVLAKGDRLGPAELGILAAVGLTKVKVHQRPRVGVLSTGNEVVEPGQPLAPGQVYDSNRTTLTAALREEGLDPVDLGIATDNRESLVMCLGKAMDEVDVLITSGGVSMGEKDLLKPVLEDHFNATIHFGRVLMKPGKPTTFATIKRNGKDKLVFALPGNPVSSVVTFYLFVVPTLRKMAGWRNPHLTSISVKLESPVSLDPRPEYQRAIIDWSSSDADGLPWASTTRSQCSSSLLNLRSANGLLVLPARSEGRTRLEAGAVVRALLLTKLL